uniref:Tenascin N n=1 Tax=Myotis lucifugus TaxID=59463 RepID=G1NV70_MYOLU
SPRMGTFCFPLGLLFGSVLLVASAPAPLEPHSCSDKEQQLTVSHTYKIDVPKSALVQVEADPQPLSDEGASLLALGEAEEQNIIFRHNIRLQTPQKDCELAGLVQDLLARVQKLEGEMAEVKERCDVQRCCQGAAGQGRQCSGHGTFSQETCGCRCEQGWEGAACEVPACPGACSGHGRCEDGRSCAPSPLWGPTAPTPACPGTASGQGVLRCRSVPSAVMCVCVCVCVSEVHPDVSSIPTPVNGTSPSCSCSPHSVAPQGLQLLKSTEESLLVSWEPSSEVDHYLLSYHPLGREHSRKQIQVPKEQNSYDILGLLPGTKYIVTLHNVKKGVPSSPQHLLATTGWTGWAAKDTRDLVEVLKERLFTCLTWISLWVGNPGGGHSAGVLAPEPVLRPSTGCLFPGLQPGMDYKITIVPMRGDLEGRPIFLNGRTEIDGPTNVATDRVTEDTAVVSWDPVQAVIDKYMVRYTSADGQSWDTAVSREQSSTVLTGLTPGEVYRVHVWAERGGQESKKANTTALTGMDGAGSSRQGVKHIEGHTYLGWNSIRSSLREGEGTGTSHVNWSSLSGVGMVRVPTQHSQTTDSALGLSEAMVNHIYTQQILQEGFSGKEKKTNSFYPKEIDSPQNLVTDRVTETTATISWEPVQAVIDRYMVRYTSADGDTREVPVGKEQSSTVLTGLRPGVEYTVHVWAQKGDRESQKVDTKAPTEIDSPTNLVTDRVTETTATISWEPVQAVIDGYMVRYTSADGDTREVPVGKEQSSTVLTGLRPGMEYTVHVWAQKGDRESRKADTKAPTDIDSPQNLVTDRVTETTATISWEPVQAVIDRYMVRYTSADGDTREVPVGKEQSSTVLTGLRPGVEYTVHVWAQKGNRESKKADTRAPTGKGALLLGNVRPVTLSVWVVNFFFIPDTGRIHDLWREEWCPVIMDYTHHAHSLLPAFLTKQVDVCVNEQYDDSGFENKAKPVSSIGPDALTNTIMCTGWECDIRLLNDRGNGVDFQSLVYCAFSLRSQSLSGERRYMSRKELEHMKWKNHKHFLFLDIDSPQNLVTIRVTETTATISWEPVQAVIDRYMVRYTSADGDTREVPVGKEQSSTVLTGLRPGMEYTVHVWAQKGNRESQKADTKASTEIDSPQNLVTDRVTETTATISWEPVQAVIDRYTVRYTSADGDTREVPVGKEQSSTVLTGLRPGVEYTVHVWAQKGDRESQKADTKALTDIDPPRNFRPSAVTQSGGVLTWTRPSAQINGYILTYQFPDGTTKEVQLGRGDQRFELQGLEQGVTYPVSLVAFKGDRRSRSVSIALSTVGARFPHPSDCSQVQQNSNVASGLYTIYLHGDASQPLQVYCDMDTDGGGWIVFQRRNTGQLDFFKRWRTYVEGFGDPTKEFWFGLDKLHNLTTGTPTRYEVRVDLQTANESAYAVYDFFQVASSKERYRLTVGKYRGTAGDALSYHNGWKFTTFDRDNDIALSNCALTHHGGWWYKNCHLANPNGRYGETKHSEGVNWEPWKGHEFSIPYVELKIRPQGYSGELVLGRKKRTLGENSRTF